MAHLHLSDDHVDLRLSWMEKVMAVRGDLRFARSDVESVEVFEDGLRATEGWRAPGLGIPGLRRIGTWRSRGGKQLVSVRRNQPAVRITLRRSGYRAVVVGVDDPAAVRASLTSHQPRPAG